MIDGLTEEQALVIKEVEKQLPMIATLPEPERSRCYMCLSYEYFILDMEEKGFALIEKADPNYFGKQLSEDMKNIKDIDTIVFSILESLMKGGYVKLKVKP